MSKSESQNENVKPESQILEFQSYTQQEKEYYIAMLKSALECAESSDEIDGLVIILTTPEKVTRWESTSNVNRMIGWLNRSIFRMSATVELATED